MHPADQEAAPEAQVAEASTYAVIIDPENEETIINRTNTPLHGSQMQEAQADLPVPYSLNNQYDILWNANGTDASASMHQASNQLSYKLEPLSPMAQASNINSYALNAMLANDYLGAVGNGLPLHFEPGGGASEADMFEIIE